MQQATSALSAAPTRRIETWIPTANPFCLPKPPDWFLDELYAYDEMLRIFASVYEERYQIMRKTTTSPPWTRVIENKPDTAIAVHHKLWPVLRIIPFQSLGFSWARALLVVKEHDQQRFSSGMAVARHLEAREERAAQVLAATQADEADQRAADFYKTMRTLTGGRTSLAFRRPEGAGFGKMARRRPAPRRAYRPEGAGAGAMFVGRSAGVMEARSRGEHLTPRGPLIISGR